MNPQPSALMQIVVSLLTPFLQAGDCADAALARRAAEQAIAAYGTGPLVTIAQIVAFALTALDDLRLSMGADLSLTMKLKLRANANALNRGSLHATRTLDEARHAPPPEEFTQWAAEPAGPPETPNAPIQNAPIQKAPIQKAPIQKASNPDPAVITAAIPAEIPAQEPVPTNLPVAQQNNRNWANAMSKAASELQARASVVSPAQRKADSMWINVLSTVARDLRQPNPAQPMTDPTQPAGGGGKAALLRSTLLASGTGFPANLGSFKVGKPTG